MTSNERNAVLTLAGVFSLRMVGLFMIVPVLSIYGVSLQDASPAMIGMALGAYGLAQLLLQIPFGLWADRFNRRRLIMVGLLLFVLGGLIAALSDSIWGVIIGRFLQGSGAISAVVMALLADVVREENRTRAMATVGMSIGLSFSIAFVLGPLIVDASGLSGLFLVSAIMGSVAIALCWWRVPDAQVADSYLPPRYRDMLRRALANKELGRINLGIFVLHFVLMACFVVLPPLLVKQGLPASEHGWLYLPVMFVAFVALIPAVLLAETRHKMREIYLFAIAALATAVLILSVLPDGLKPLLFAVALFFFAFNLLEALLPSLVSKLAPAGGKGTAMGLYSTFQFAGAFLGGVVGGLLSADLLQLFFVLLAAVMIWLAYAWFMPQPRYLQSVMLKPAHDHFADDLLASLPNLPGVEEVVIMADDGVVYLKVEKKVWQPELLSAWPVRIISA